MPQAEGDAEIRALGVLIAALEPLDDDARTRVLEYTLRRLGMRELSARPAREVSAPAAKLRDEAPVRKSGGTTDIRALRAEKEPSSAIEMAAVVAYYLAEAAPEDERKDAVTTADIERYFKQAAYPLPGRIDATLNNAAAAGYFDRAGRGKYRLNPVG